MDRERFTEKKTGELRTFRNPHTQKADWLFIPNEMPPSWEFPVSLWPLLSEAKEALGKLDGIGQTIADPQLLLRPLQTREAITSSRIEGTYVTPAQLLLYELDPKEPSSADGEVADWKEVWNYSKALQQGCTLLAKLPPCSRLIRKIHKTLMAGVRGQGAMPGEFRRLQVQIGSTGRYVPPPPDAVPALMGNLDKYINSAAKQYDPLVMCYIAHYQFEAIHPFNDGNGRVGRLLLALMVYKWLGHSKPWLYMSAFFEKYRDEYADNLLRTSTNGDWTRWIEFCLNGTLIQATDSIRRCHKFNELRTTYHDRMTTPTPRSHKIIESLFTSPVVTIPSIAERCETTYHTARADIEKLVEAGILLDAGNTRPKSFYAPEIMLAAYGNPEEDEALE